MTSLPKPTGVSAAKTQTMVMQLILTVPRSASELDAIGIRNHLIKQIEGLIPDLQRNWGVYLETIQTALED